MENEDTHQFVGHRVSEGTDKCEEVASALSGQITTIISDDLIWRLMGLPAGSPNISYRWFNFAFLPLPPGTNLLLKILG